MSLLLSVKSPVALLPSNTVAAPLSPNTNGTISSLADMAIITRRERIHPNVVSQLSMPWMTLQ